jgi:hypothetical protein
MFFNKKKEKSDDGGPSKVSTKNRVEKVAVALGRLTDFRTPLHSLKRHP